MAQVFIANIEAHKSIYSLNTGVRYLKVKYSIPNNDVNKNTGMLIIVPGYGGNIDSKVYCHIMEDFPDLYNYVVVQCQYFGSEYMQVVPENIMNEAEDMAMTSNTECQFVLKLGENEDCFNDMGIMQAIDVITATIHVLTNLTSDIDTNKIVIFGTSHGAYLAHLANILCPGLFKYLLDISGYTFPYFLNNLRQLGVQYTHDKSANFIFSYLINENKNLRYDSSLYDLEFLYDQIDNKCRIICYQGNHDWMIDYEEKMNFINSIDNSEFILITEKDVDEVIFKNTDHGLGLNYINFLHTKLKNIEKECSVVSNVIALNDVIIPGKISVTYDNLYPFIRLTKTSVL